MPQLKIRIIEARGIKAADLNGKSDPYTVVTTAESKVQTKVISANLSPTWNEEKTVTISDPHNDAVCFQVFDHDAVGKDDLLGYIPIMVNDLVQGKEKDVWLELKGSSGEKKEGGKKEGGKKEKGGAKGSFGSLHVALTAVDFTTRAPMMPPQGNVPPQGYAAPPQGYAPPPQGYAPPPQGYAAPPQGYAPPPQGYAAPPQGYAAPPQGYAAPPQGYAPPPQGYAAPPQGYAPPPQGYAQPPPQGYAMPQQGYAQPPPQGYGQPPQAQAQAQALPGLMPYHGKIPQGWQLKNTKLSPLAKVDVGAIGKDGKKVLKGIGKFIKKAL